MRALIFANGRPPSLALALALAANAQLVVGADGGGDVAADLGIALDLVVGDLDSVSERLRASLPPGALLWVPDPERSDLEKAVDLAAERGATAIDIVGASGGRGDHALANFSVLLRHRALDVRLVDEHFSVRLVNDVAAIDLPVGTVVSLVALRRCEGVSTSGLRWPLADEALEFNSRGVHNEVAERPASVSVRTGELLLFEGRWVEKHG